MQLDAPEPQLLQMPHIRSLVRAVGIGIGAEDWAGTGQVTIGDALKSKYQPMLWISWSRIASIASTGSSAPLMWAAGSRMGS